MHAQSIFSSSSSSSFFFFWKLSIPIRNVRLSPVLDESYPLFYHFSVRRKIGVISLEIDTCPARRFHNDFTSVTRRHVTTSTSGWGELTFPSEIEISLPRDPEARLYVSFRDQFFPRYNGNNRAIVSGKFYSITMIANDESERIICTR